VVPVLMSRPMCTLLVQEVLSEVTAGVRSMCSVSPDARVLLPASPNKWISGSAMETRAGLLSLSEWSAKSEEFSKSAILSAYLRRNYSHELSNSRGKQCQLFR
jgi:hypothetical protein